MYILLSGKMNVHRLNEPDKENVTNDQPINLFPEKIRSQPFIADITILGQCLATLGKYIFLNLQNIFTVVRILILIIEMNLDLNYLKFKLGY